MQAGAPRAKTRRFIVERGGVCGRDCAGPTQFRGSGKVAKAVARRLPPTEHPERADATTGVVTSRRGFVNAVSTICRG
jgi:hypothetical protein